MNTKDWELYSRIMEYSDSIEDKDRVKRIANQAAQVRSRTQAGIAMKAYKDLMFEADKQRKLNASFGTWREWLVVTSIIALIILLA